MSDPIPGTLPCPRYFITLRLADANDDRLVRHIVDLRRAMRATRAHHPFEIEAIAVLPSALHTIWALPTPQAQLSWRIGMLKSKFSRAMRPPSHRSASQIARGDKGIWQRSYWSLELTTATDFARQKAVIHAAPVAAGLCTSPADWPHSSIHRDLRHQTLAQSARSSQMRLQYLQNDHQPALL